MKNKGLMQFFTGDYEAAASSFQLLLPCLHNTSVAVSTFCCTTVCMASPLPLLPGTEETQLSTERSLEGITKKCLQNEQNNSNLPKLNVENKFLQVSFHFYHRKC